MDPDQINQTPVWTQTPRSGVLPTAAATEQTIPPTPPAPEPPKKNNSKLVIVSVIAIVLAVAVFVPIPNVLKESAFCQPCDPGLPPSQCPKCPQKGDIEWKPSLAKMLWGKLSKTYQKGELVPVTTPTSSPSPTINPTANWKTYTIANYTFQYPPTFNFQESSVSSVYARFESTSYPNLIFSIVLDGAGVGFQCVEQISSLEESVNGHAIKKVTLRGTTPTKEPPCDQQDQSNQYTIITTLNPSEKLNDDFIFSFSTKELSLDQAQTTLNQILSTFKFLN